VTFDLDRLYSLLPEIYRIRDKEQGGQLKALLSVIADQVEVLEEDLSQLYDDQFIETCADWAVPYIGDLIGFRGQKMPEDVFLSQRAQVANTISARKRKGTFSAIEDIVRDSSGWDCAVVECFKLLAATQNMNHMRPDNQSMADVRPWQNFLSMNRPFGKPSHLDRLSHNIDVRSIDICNRRRGLYNIPNVAVFIWRLKARCLKGSPAWKIDGTRYTFNPLGNDTQLFCDPGISKISMPISRSMLYSFLSRPDRSSGIGSLSLQVNGREVFPRGTISGKPMKVIACDLSDLYDNSGKMIGWSHAPVKDGIIAIDPQLGRIAFPSGQTIDSVRTTFFYGFAANMGGGKYARFESFSDLPGKGYALVAKRASGQQDDKKLIEDAIASLGNRGGVIEIGGSVHGEEERYDLRSLVLDVSGGRKIEIRALDGYRPLLVLGEDMVIKGDGGSVFLNGLVISGKGIRVSMGLEQLKVSHCTLVPGLVPGKKDMSTPSIIAISDGQASGIIVEIEKSITGPLRMPAEGAELVIKDSIIDSPSRGRGARIFPALQSGPIKSLHPGLNHSLSMNRIPIRPCANITIAGDGPHRAVLSGSPRNLDEVGAMLETAIRAACDSPAFKGTRVVSVNERLIIVPGVPGDVVIEDSEFCRLASMLKLSPRSSRKTSALMGGPLPVELSLTSPSPALTAYWDGSEPHIFSFASSKNPLKIAAALQEFLQTLSEYKGIAVAFLDGRLVITNADEARLPIFGPSRSGSSGIDETTFRELGLERDVPAISFENHKPGPETTIERSTILGMVVVKRLSLASESIFADPLIVDQRQEGCLRFSFVPRGSQAPKRHECPSGEDTWTEGLRFTSTSYGDPKYCQLSMYCAPKIRQGDGGAELGAFHNLYQPQREMNMMMSLAEHRKFGIEFGIFYST
jgi:hypothetical protein